jgi:hypothetical protein
LPASQGQRSKDQAGLMPSQEVCMPRARHFITFNFTSAFALAHILVGGGREHCSSNSPDAMNNSNIRAPRLLERYREEMLVRRYVNRTITGYVSWERRYLRLHHLRHPLAHCCSSSVICRAPLPW